MDATYSTFIKYRAGKQSAQDTPGCLFTAIIGSTNTPCAYAHSLSQSNYIYPLDLVWCSWYTAFQSLFCDRRWPFTGEMQPHDFGFYDFIPMVRVQGFSARISAYFAVCSTACTLPRSNLVGWSGGGLLSVANLTLRIFTTYTL